MSAGLTKTGKAARLLATFQAVPRQAEHFNYGDEGPCLRDYGIAGQVANLLIRWGEQEGLVCWFESPNRRTDGRMCWQAAFLDAAFKLHRQRHGDQGDADLVKNSRTRIRKN